MLVYVQINIFLCTFLLRMIFYEILQKPHLTTQLQNINFALFVYSEDPFARIVSVHFPTEKYTWLTGISVCLAGITQYPCLGTKWDLCRQKQ